MIQAARFMMCVLLGILVGVIMPLMMPGSARAACRLETRTAVSLLITQGTIMLPVEVNGLAAIFILDTGAQRSVVTEAAVRRLGLQRDEWAGTTLNGVGGLARRANAVPHSLSLGGLPLVRRTLNDDVSLTVGILPQTQIGNLVIDGLLGRDFLSPFDLDLDMRQRRLALYKVSGCSGRFLPWSEAYTAIPVDLSVATAPILPVVINATSLTAMLDTGASASLLTAPGMYHLGLNAASLANDPADQISGLGPSVITAHLHRFRSMLVAGQTSQSPAIWVEAVRIRPFVDMLLGADWLAGRRVWLSFATSQLFMTQR